MMISTDLSHPRIKSGRVGVFLTTLKKQRFLLFLLLPGLAYFILFKYGPLYGLMLAFKDYDPREGILGSDWAGLKYFKMMIGMNNFWRVVGNTLKISLLKIATGFPAPIILALLLNEIKAAKFKRVVQTISYLPHFLSWVVVSGLVFQILSPSYGFYGLLCSVMGWKTQVLLGDPNTFLVVLLTSNIWKEVGYSSIIYLAAIAGIGSEMYEAATLDGAGRFKQCLYITLPCLAPTISVLFVLGLGGILDGGFDQIFNLYNTLVLPSVDIIDTFVYRIGLQNNQFSFSTAVGISKSLIAVTLVLFSNWLVGKLSDYTIW